MFVWVNLDRFIVLGLVGVIMVFVGYVVSNFGVGWLVFLIVGYVVYWFGDLFDGSLVCYCGVEWLFYGYFIDYSCDGLVMLLIFVGMGFSLFVMMDIVMIVLVGYLLLLIYVFFLVRVLGEFKLFYFVVGFIEMWIVLIVLILVMMVFGIGFGLFGVILGFDLFVGMVGFVLIVLFIV